MNQQSYGKPRQNHPPHEPSRTAEPRNSPPGPTGQGSHPDYRRSRPYATPRGGKTKQHPPEPATDGFLNHSFLPIVAQDEITDNQNAIETAFWRSFTNLCDGYGLGLCATTLEWAAVYPLNIELAYQKAREALAITEPNLSLLIADCDELPPALTVARTVQTTYTVYFLGLEDLWKRLRQKRVTPVRQLANALSVSALTYLRQVVGIGCLWEAGELRWAIERHIEMTRESQEDEGVGEQEGNDTADYYKKAFTALIGKAAAFDKLANQPRHLSRFAANYQALQAATPTSKRKGGLGVKAHTNMVAVAGALLQLYRDYPTRNYADSFRLDEAAHDVDYYITPDSRIGFVWNQTDWMSSILHENLDMEFNSGAEVIEPVAVHHLSEPLPAAGFADDFDERLFAALDALHHLL